MRASEFIVEYEVHRVQPSSELNIIVDSHYMDRYVQRGVGSHRTVAHILKKLPTLLDQLREVEYGDKIWVFQPATMVAIGLQRQMDKRGMTEFVLRTVIPWAPHKDGITNIITV